MIFIIPKGHSYYPENFRSQAYGLSKQSFLGILKLVPEPEGAAKNLSDAHFKIHDLVRKIEMLLVILRLMG